MRINRPIGTKSVPFHPPIAILSHPTNLQFAEPHQSYTLLCRQLMAQASAHMQPSISQQLQALFKLFPQWNCYPIPALPKSVPATFPRRTASAAPVAARPSSQPVARAGMAALETSAPLAQAERRYSEVSQTSEGDMACACALH